VNSQLTRTCKRSADFPRNFRTLKGKIYFGLSEANPETGVMRNKAPVVSMADLGDCGVTVLTKVSGFFIALPIITFRVEN